MAKDTFWFKHDYNARNDEKILELRSICGSESYGVYWMIVETMADNENGGINKNLLGGLSGGFGVAKGRLEEIIKCCLDVQLFYEKDGFYFSGRMLRHKEERKFFSDMGKEGAERKRQKYGGAKGGLNRGEQRRGEKIFAISFEENYAVFSDGTKQQLGNNQLLRLNLDDLKPQDVLKGQIN